jgi:hypothetical protein
VTIPLRGAMGPEFTEEAPMNMRIAIVGGLTASLVGAPVVMAQDKCPVELREAKGQAPGGEQDNERAALGGGLPGREQ